MIKLFSGYGFDYRTEYSSENLLVFTIKQGIFDNAIVIYVFEDEKHVVEHELSKIGFAVKTYKCSSLNNVEDVARVDEVLFKAFFLLLSVKSYF